jgi:hypothetical protein
MSTRQQPCPSGRYWRVKPGDTLFNIALRTATPVNQLLELNPGINPNNLRIDSLICYHLNSLVRPGYSGKLQLGILLIKSQKQAIQPLKNFWN